MKWKIELDVLAVKSLNKLDKLTRRRIEKFLIKLSTQDNPRLQGAMLTGQYKGKWRYRVGDYRLICQIQDQAITILILELGHRREIYNLKK